MARMASLYPAILRRVVAQAIGEGAQELRPRVLAAWATDPDRVMDLAPSVGELVLV